MPENDLTPRRAAALVQRDLIHLERGDDAQLRDAARLLSTLCDTSIKLGLPVQLGDRVIQAAIRSVTIRGDARRASATLHEELSVLARTLDIPVADAGFPKMPFVPAPVPQPTLEAAE